jgi:ABC-type dipeptide/oligopeptide/nickel transport system permease subunit
MSRALDIPGDLPGPSDLVVRSSVLRRVVRNPLGVLALVVLAIVVLAAVFGPMVSPFDENFANIDRMLAPAGGEHLLGTDSAGRDVWSRLLYGAQITLLSALLCAAVAIAIGLPAGLVAGYYGGWFDSVPSWVANLLMSLPASSCCSRCARRSARRCGSR